MAVLGRFLHSLNQFAFEEFGLNFDLSDYKEYNFAKVSAQRGVSAQFITNHPVAAGDTERRKYMPFLTSLYSVSDMEMQPGRVKHHRTPVF